MRPKVSDLLRAQVEAQCTPEEAKLIFDWMSQYGDCDPADNPTMHENVNAPDYIDRGMWGPLGGKGGTVSRLWLEDQKYLRKGGPSEFGLMMIIESPGK